MGPMAGQPKFWPWFWLICPAFLLVTPIAFGLTMIFDHRNFRSDIQNLFRRHSSKV